MPVACEYPDLEDWTQIQDAELRKRVQNRLSQRRHREKIRKQNGTPNATSNRKARSDTTSAASGSSSASRSASPQASSNISGQSGLKSNDEVPVLDTWDEQTEDNLALDADWNDFTFLDSPTLDNDALFSFSSNLPTLQTSQLLPPTFPVRTYPQLSSSTDDSSRLCSCGAHAAKAILGNNASRLSQYHAMSMLPQLPSPAPLPSMTVSETPLSSATSPVRVPSSLGRNTLTLNPRTSRAVSERPHLSRMQSTGSSDSAIELSMAEHAEDGEPSLSSNSSRKRSRAATINECSNVAPPSTDATKPEDPSKATSPSQQDDNAILQRVSEVLAEFVQDDEPTMKRRKRAVQEIGGEQHFPGDASGEGKIGSLPQIRRGTLPGGGQIIVIVMQP